jgi:hypothetical protein
VVAKVGHDAGLSDGRGDVMEKIVREIGRVYICRLEGVGR